MAKYDHGGGCACGLEKVCDCKIDSFETKDQGAFIGDFDDLLGHVSRLPLKDQKDLAEDILRRLTEGHWECHWDSYSLSVSKTESL